MYPVVKIGRLPLELGNHNAVADALVGLSRFPHLTADQYFYQFFSEAKRIDARLMILSAEHFIGGEPRVWNVSDEETFSKLYCNKIRALVPYLFGHEVTLLVYLRPQVDWLASGISQTIRISQLIAPGKMIYRDDRKFFEMNKPLLRYYKLIDSWVRILKPRKIMVVPYERESLHKNSSITDFLYRIGLERYELPFGSDTSQVNRSISREYIEAKKILNLTARNKNEERVIINCLERLTARSKTFIPYRLNPLLLEDVINFVRPENNKLNEEYIYSDIKLKEQSSNYKKIKYRVLSEKEIMDAVADFQNEFHTLHSRLLRIDYSIREVLRKHAKPLHSALHQIKRKYRSMTN